MSVGQSAAGTKAAAVMPHSRGTHQVWVIVIIVELCLIYI